jgi:hypothetical protein
VESREVAGCGGVGCDKGKHMSERPEFVYWVQRDGSPARAEAAVDLGWGIERAYPRRGFRRMLWDFCFGYVSGYPVRDVLAFCWHHGTTARVERNWLEKRRAIMGEGDL